MSTVPVARGGKEGIAESRDGRSLPVALEARGAGDEERLNVCKGSLADAPLFIPPQSPKGQDKRKKKKDKRQKD